MVIMPATITSRRDLRGPSMNRQTRGGTSVFAGGLLVCSLSMSDTRALILTIIGTGLAGLTIVVTVLSMLIAGVNARIGDLGDGLRSMDVRLRAVDDRLRAVEVGFGRVEQRLETIERAILPSAAPDAP